MAGTLTVQNLQGPTTGANANKVILPAGHTLDTSGGTLVPSAGQIVQVQNWIDQSNGTQINSTTNSHIYNTLYTISFTPKLTGSKTVICANIFLGYSRHTSSTNADSDNTGIVFYRGSTKIIGKSTTGDYIQQSLYGTDVPITGTSPYYGQYDGKFYSYIQLDPTLNTANTTVTYYLKGWTYAGGSGATINYNRTHQRAESGGPSTYQLMEIAQ